MSAEIFDISVGILKTRYAVEEFCLTSPFTIQRTCNGSSTLISLAVTIHGPTGQKVSRLFERNHGCLFSMSILCMSRAVTLFKTV